MIILKIWNLPESERTDILMMRVYADRRRSFEEVHSLFNEVNPDYKVSKSTVSPTVQTSSGTRYQEVDFQGRRPMRTQA